MRLLVLCVFLILFAPSASAWDATIVGVSDGDTVIVQREASKEHVKIRLYGVDCPEGYGRYWKPQPYSKVARSFVQKLLPVGSKVAVVDMGMDRYSRTVGGIITLPDGKVIQEELLKAGLAWVYPKYCENCGQWQALQNEAKSSRIGLWRDATPIAPWDWRHNAQDD